MSIKPSKAEDTTLHLSLPTAYDIEEALEEASRLRRIGHFKAAIRIYEQDLAQFLNIKYVMIQYAECLLGAGQTSKFSELSMELSDGHPMDSLDLNWKFMKLWPDNQKAFPPRQEQLLADAFNAIWENWPRLDSTEVKLLTYGLYKFEGDLDWHALYRHLRNESMIWEFNELLTSMAPKYGLEASWRQIFPRARDIPTSCFEELDQDWPKEGTDTSTNFALLDMLTTCGLIYLRMRDTWTKARECLEKAGEYAALLRSQDASNIKTRPYLRWMVAKAMVEEYPARPWTLVENEQGPPSPIFPGFIAPTGIFPDQSWPLFAPLDDQILVEERNYAVINKKLATIAKAAEEIGDVLLRTACLKELVLNGAEGTECIMEKLEDLWTESGHPNSISQMHLYQYLLIKEPSDNEKVRRRILLDGETSTGMNYYARCRIMATLATSERERNHYQREIEEYKYATRYREMRKREMMEEREVPGESSRPYARGHDSQESHRSSGGREREKSPESPRTSDGQKTNRKPQESSLRPHRPSSTLAPTGPPMTKRLALKEKEQNEITRSREIEAAEKREDDAIAAAAASRGTMADLTVAEFRSKNSITSRHEDDDDAESEADETEILQPLVKYGHHPESEDVSQLDSRDALPGEKVTLE
ncbi:unnamed protein product [Clonostachys rosea]|uniref:Uncharacterized protein n=1 Tax=Bionectria ochroleuca TaxID=29856 RepID=A0ABY6UC35_BIOOC|nr:unnamed protein product [Clonostachys rosea]